METIALQDVGLQAAKALCYYVALVMLMRFAGKRLAGQTTTFDLLVLITLGVVIQSAALEEGTVNAAVFVITVFIAHRSTAAMCVRWASVRRWVRGKPRALVHDGRIIESALRHEGMTEQELLAGLRKLGYESAEDVHLAMLEETGHISAVSREDGPGGDRATA